MTTYAIGDVQGCLAPLQALVQRLGFLPGRDRLLFAGDLVNRGPQSLEVLRLVKSLGPAAVTVLGNHDLHLLAAAHTGSFGAKDTLQPIMQAPDRDELLAWLRRQPLAHEDPASGALLVHAGVPPQWDRKMTLALAAEVNAVLAGPDSGRFLERMYGNEPDRWRPDLRDIPRLRFIINCLTRLRYCDAKGRIHLKPKGAPGTQPAGLLPWFGLPGRKTAGDTIVFGHWSTLGQVHWPEHRVYCLDTGCVWGRRLTALNLDTGELIAEDSPQYRQPEISTA